MPSLTTPKAITEAVEAVNNNFAKRQARQDTDYERWWRSSEFNVNTDVDGSDLGTDFRSFTSNESQTFARKV
mgnify:CR=1 FL=1